MKSGTAFPNLYCPFTSDVTRRRNRREITSGPQTNAYNSETIRDGIKVIINRKWEVGDRLSEFALTFVLRRHLAEKPV